jgi:Flp pilus assembly pilin Flp
MAITIRLFSQYKGLQARFNLWANNSGQDLIEYSLMAGFVSVAAGAIMPGIAISISLIFSKVACVMSKAATQPS